MFKLLLAISCLALHSYSYANSQFGPVKIKSVTISDFNMMVVTIEADGEAKHTEQCDPARKETLVISTTSPYEKEIFSVALAAFASGKPIRGWANGCHVFGSNYKSPRMTVISIVNE